jgi:FKBP-type peptidyl-prolyl cis-trans isomerase 2
MSRLKREVLSAMDIFATIVVVLILITAVLGFFLYQNLSVEPHTSPTGEVIDDNDVVEFDYIGFFEDNTVFETTIEEVATDNDSYPKSLLFSWPIGGIFQPVEVFMGQGIPGYSFEDMVNKSKILQDALLDMRENETRSVLVTPEDGFLYPDPSKVVTKSLTEKFDQTVVMTEDQFIERYKTGIIQNSTFTDPLMGWEVRIIMVDHNVKEVTVKHQPDPGEILSPYKGFQSEVTSIDSGANEGKGEITLTHLLTEEDAGKVMGNFSDEGRFTVVNVDEAAGTFDADYNSEKAGRYLRYEITVVGIVKS